MPDIPTIRAAAVLAACFAAPLPATEPPDGAPAGAPGQARLPGTASGAADSATRRAEGLGSILLLAEFHCTACHSPAGTGVDDDAPDGPEAPDLRQAARLADPSWLERFIADPGAARPGARMPRLLAHLPPAEQAAAATRLAAYLRASAAPPRPPATPRHSDPAGGRALFQRIGCVACHPADPRSSPSPHDARGPAAISLAGLEERFELGGLTEFLLDPLKPRPAGRMPRFPLTPDEAADLAGYLIGFDPEAPPPPPRAALPPTDEAVVEEGRRLFHQLRCVSCHDDPGPSDQAPSPVQQLQAPPLRALDPAAVDGCLAPDRDPAAGVPRFRFSDRQAELLRRGIPLLSDLVLSPGDRLDLRLAALNCLACHTRNGTGGVPASIAAHFAGDPSLGDEGRFPPDLSGAGSRLRPGWILSVLGGEVRARPYLEVEMPFFGERQRDDLAALFRAADAPAGGAADSWDPAAHHPDMPTGSALLGTAGGLGCINCHGWKDRRGLAMDALRLDGMPGRLHAAAFRTALLDPPSVRPGTLMPSFWPGGESSLPAVLDGDPDRQIASIWAFLEDGREPPPGFPDAATLPFEIVPEQSVVVQRGFMKPGGTRGIAIGFPQGIHFIYDAGRCGPVVAWRGRFIDGYGVWFSRREPTAEPLEEKRFDFPADPPFAVEDAGEAGTDPAFRGYRLEGPDRRPVFLSRIGPLEIEDRIGPTGADGGLRRSIRIRNAGNDAARITLSDAHQTADDAREIAREAAAGSPHGPGPVEIAPGRQYLLELLYQW